MLDVDGSEIDVSLSRSSVPSQASSSLPEARKGGRPLPQFSNLPPGQMVAEARHLVPGRGDLRISLTSACNLKCDYCHNEGQTAPWLHGRKTTVTLETIERMLDLAARHGVRSVKLSGGDPGLHPGIVAVLGAVVRWRDRYPMIAKWGMCTNGGPFLNARKFEALIASALDNISVGIDSVDPDELSKPGSPVGIPGPRLIEAFVKPLLARWNGALKFDTVFTGDQRRTLDVIRAARDLRVNVSVVEVNGVMDTAHTVREKFLELISKTAKEFRLEPKLHEPLNEIYLFDDDGNTPIKFYQDHCRDLDCGHCRKIHLRVSPTPEGWAAVPCFLQAQARTIPLMIDGELSASRFADAITHNGRGPRWFDGTLYGSAR
jgi:molybdenum cofactor biosynthesis enzyme MoaA